MKKMKSLSAVLVGSCALALVPTQTFGETYHLDPTFKPSVKVNGVIDNPFTNAVRWIASDGVTRAGAQGEALPGRADDVFLLGYEGSYTYHYFLYFTAIDPEEWTLPGKEIHFGDCAAGTKETFLHYPKQVKTNAGIVNWKTAFFGGGAYIFNSAHNATYTINGAFTIETPASDPFRIACSYSNCTVNIQGSLAAAADKTLRIGGESEQYKKGGGKNSDYPPPIDHTFNFTASLESYAGTLAFSNAEDLVATPAHAAIRAVFGSQTMPGAIRMPKHMYLGVRTATDTFTVATLAGETGAYFDLPISADGAAKIVVTDAFSLTGPATLALHGAFDTATVGTHNLTLLKVPLADRDALDWITVVPNLETETVLGGGWSVVTDEAAQTASLVFSYTIDATPAVYLLTGDSGSKDNKTDYPDQMSSALTNAENWSDGKLPTDSTIDYFVRKVDGKVRYLRGPQAEELDFTGKSLTIGDGCAFLPIRHSTFAKLRLLNGSSVGVPNVQWLNLNGPIEAPYGTVIFRRHVSRVINLQGAISGRAELRFEGWDNTSSPVGRYTLCADNSSFLGTICVTEHAGMEPAYGTTSQVVTIEKATSLGGALPRFNPKATVVERCGTLQAHGSMTLAESSNRGVYIGDRGCLKGEYDTTTFTFNTPLTVAGELRIEGPGTIALCKPLLLDGDSPALDLVSGTLKLADSNAINGLKATLHEAGQIVFVCKPSDAVRTLWGLRVDKVAVPFTLDAASGLEKLPISFELNLDELTGSGEQEIGLLTVAADDAAGVAALLPAATSIYTGSHYAPSIVQRANAEAGTVTFALHLVPRGLILLVR